MRTTIMQTLATLAGKVAPHPRRVVVLVPETHAEKEQGVIPYGYGVAMLLDDVRVVSMAATGWPLELYALQRLASTPGRYLVQARTSAHAMAPGPFAFAVAYTSILEQPPAYPPLAIGSVVEFEATSYDAR